MKILDAFSVTTKDNDFIKSVDVQISQNNRAVKIHYTWSDNYNAHVSSYRVLSTDEY